MGGRARLRAAAQLAACAVLAAGCGAGEELAAPGAPEVSAAARRAQEEGAAAGSPWFVDAAAEAGLDFVHFNGMSGALDLAEITCGGGALLDYDGDGDLDVYLRQGRMWGPGKTLDEALVPPRHPPPLTDRLYRNDLEVGADGAPRLRFTDVTRDARLPETAYGCGIAVGDFDGDSRPDLFLANLGRDELLRNRGDGTFQAVTDRAGVSDERSTIAGAFFDYDRDGRLDLFAINYATFGVQPPPVCRDLTGARDYCGPGSYPFEPDRLYRNRGDGTFEDVTERAGIGGEPRPALGLVVADLDGDGWLDVYVANDGQPNHLWMNRGDGTFEDRALLAGSAVNAAGESEAGMGVDAGDFDGDGDLDLFVVHLIKETNTLYRNDGAGMFEDWTLASGLGPPSMPYTSFGAGWLDVEGDGWLDLLVVNGAVTRVPELVRAGDRFPLHQPNQLFRNLGGALPGRAGVPGGAGGVRFAEVTAEAGEAFRLSEVSRGAAFGDVDGDGDTDVLVVNNNGPVRLLLNQVGNRRPWLGVRLVEGDPPRDAPGARAALLRDGRPAQLRRVRIEGSYASASDPRILFAPGRDGLETVRAFWPDGAAEDFDGVETGRYTTLRRGAGRAVR